MKGKICLLFFVTLLKDTLTDSFEGNVPAAVKRLRDDENDDGQRWCLVYEVVKQKKSFTKKRRSQEIRSWRIFSWTWSSCRYSFLPLNRRRSFWRPFWSCSTTRGTNRQTVSHSLFVSVEKQRMRGKERNDDSSLFTQKKEMMRPSYSDARHKLSLPAGDSATFAFSIMIPLVEERRVKSEVQEWAVSLQSTSLSRQFFSLPLFMLLIFCFSFLPLSLMDLSFYFSSFTTRSVLLAYYSSNRFMLLRLLPSEQKVRIRLKDEEGSGICCVER